MSAVDWFLTGITLLPIVLTGFWFAGTLLVRAATARPYRAPTIGPPPRWQGPPAVAPNRVDALRNAYVRGRIELDEFDRELGRLWGLKD